MCDDHTADDNEKLIGSGVSRRAFGAIGGIAALSTLMAAPANAQTVAEGDVAITTPEGTCDAYFVHPAQGKHPAVLVWPDIMGLRPAFRLMGRRLAESGYSVLVVNPFYRSQKAPVIAEGESFQDPAVRPRLMGLAQKLTPDTHVADALTFSKWLDAQPSVDVSKKMGTTGYCMGGPIVMRTAATLPDRIGAGASFHGGGLATALPTSPHLLIPKMKAGFLIAVAQNDDERDPKAKDTLREAFTAAKLSAEIEVYPAQHGWCPPDSAVYDKAQAEKAWARQLELFKKTLV